MIKLCALCLSALSTLVQAQSGIFHECNLEGGAKSYVLGTMHVGDPRVLEVAADVEREFANIERVALEIIPDNKAVLATLLATRLPKDESLKSLLSNTLYQKTLSAMAQRGVPETMLQRLQPWAVSLELSQPRAQRGTHLDLRIYQLAREAGMALVGLETPEGQLSLFAELSRDQQIVLLEHALDNLHLLDEQFERMISSYVAGDLEQLQQLADTQLQDLDQTLVTWFEDKVMKQRNKAFAEAAWPLIQQGQTLIAVGALHLPGDSGLIKLLQGLGCNFRRLR